MAQTAPNTQSPHPHTELDGWFHADRSQRPLLVIAGPCVLESDEVNLRIADCLAEACADLGLPFVFKASFDKANRSSGQSHRGPGLSKGIDQLAAIGEPQPAQTFMKLHRLTLLLNR